MKGRRAASLLLGVLVFGLFLSACQKATPAPATPKPAATLPPGATPAPTVAAISPTPSPPPTAALPAKIVTWRMGHYFPVADYRHIISQKWADTIKERTKGQIEVLVYPAEQLVKGKEIFRALVANVHQVATPLPSYFVGEIPPADLFNLPFPPWKGPGELLEATREVADGWDKQFGKHNVKYIGMLFTSAPPADLYMKKPARVLGDLKGRKVRGPGGAYDRALMAAGMAVVTLSAAEQFMALQTGTVDGVITAHSSSVSYKLYEVAPYWVTIGFGFSPYLLVVNKAEWDKLTPELQKTVHQVTTEVGQWAVGYEVDNIRKVVVEMEAKFAEHIVFPDAEIARWRELVKPLYAEYLQQTGDDGAYFWSVWEKRVK